MCSIVFDTAHVFMCSSIVDAPINALVDIFVGEVVSEIAVSSLIYLLVMTVPWPAVVASVPTTAVAISRLATVVIGQMTTAMCARPW